MPLVQFKLDRSVNQTRGIFDKYIYEPDNGDSSVTVTELNYWGESRFINNDDWSGSVIEMKLSDGYFIGVVSAGDMPIVYQVGGGQGTVEIISYADYQAPVDIQLTTTPALVTGWIEDIAPVGVSEDNGKFTFESAGVYKIDVERIYINTDNNPNDVVNLTLEIKKNGVTQVTRTAPIASATSPQEASIDTFTSPFLEVVSAGDFYEIFVSAEDNGGDPQDTRLAFMKVVADRSHDIPV